MEESEVSFVIEEIFQAFFKLRQETNTSPDKLKMNYRSLDKLKADLNIRPHIQELMEMKFNGIAVEINEYMPDNRIIMTRKSKRAMYSDEIVSIINLE